MAHLLYNSQLALHHGHAMAPSHPSSFHGRPRRVIRHSGGPHPGRHVRPVHTVKDVGPVEPVPGPVFKRDSEAAKSFDLEDDEAFCPFHLLTDDDLQVMHSGSDRSSLSSGSPEPSPQQSLFQATPGLVFSVPHGNPSPPASYASQPTLHQPLAQRSRNAIPIVDPTTRLVHTPPLSLSPHRPLQPCIRGY